MGEASSVKLHGFWASPYAMRARLALKIKGVDFEYVEEDLFNKSELLIQYNPVYRKVPVLLHNNQPIVESLIILEYIDEVWTDSPHLLPNDPYLRSKHRFWAAFLQPLFEIIGRTVRSEGEAQQQAVAELLGKMDVAEDGLKEIFQGGSPCYEEDKPGYLDIVFYSIFGFHEASEEICGVKFLTAERHPLLFTWITALAEVPEVKEVAPPLPKVVERLQFSRKRLLQQNA